MLLFKNIICKYNFQKKKKPLDLNVIELNEKKLTDNQDDLKLEGRVEVHVVFDVG